MRHPPLENIIPVSIVQKVIGTLLITNHLLGHPQARSQSFAKTTSVVESLPFLYSCYPILTSNISISYWDLLGFDNSGWRLACVEDLVDRGHIWYMNGLHVLIRQRWRCSNTAREKLHQIHPFFVTTLNPFLQCETRKVCHVLLFVAMAQAMEKDVASLGVATDRIRVYRPLTGAKDYSRAKLRDSYEPVSVEKARS